MSSSTRKTYAFFNDLAYFTPQGESVGLTEDEARWISIAAVGSSKAVDLHLLCGPRLTLLGKPVTIIPDDWSAA